MNKLILLCFALFAVVALAATSAVVEVGYKSSEIGIEDGGMGYFTIEITDEQAMFLNPENAHLEVIYDKHAAGEQDICVSTEMESECNSNSDSYYATIGADSQAITICYDLMMSNTSVVETVYISVQGVCEFSSDSTPCYSTTDADVEGVRIIEAVGDANMDEYMCPSSFVYVPFIIDTDGGNTGFYDVAISDLEEDNDGFTYPGMIVDITADTPSELYLVLDIDEVDSSSYAVAFHLTQDFCCGDSEYCMETQTNESYCQWNMTTTSSYIIYPEQDADSPGVGSYATGAIMLTEGQWTVTPYVYSMGVGTMSFRFCGGLGFECSSAAGAVPSVALLGMLMAFAARYFQ